MAVVTLPVITSESTPKETCLPNDKGQRRGLPRTLDLSCCAFAFLYMYHDPVLR